MWCNKGTMTGQRTWQPASGHHSSNGNIPTFVGKAKWRLLHPKLKVLSPHSAPF